MLSMDSGNAHCGYARYKCYYALGRYASVCGFYLINWAKTLVSDRIWKIPYHLSTEIKVEGYEDAMRTIVPKTVVDLIAKKK
jgi:hypothetical protein